MDQGEAGFQPCPAFVAGQAACGGQDALGFDVVGGEGDPGGQLDEVALTFEVHGGGVPKFVGDLAEVVAAVALVGFGEQPPLQVEPADAFRVEGQAGYELEDFQPPDPGGLAVGDQVPVAAEGLQYQGAAGYLGRRGGRAPPDRRRHHQAAPPGVAGAGGQLAALHAGKSRTAWMRPANVQVSVAAW